MLRDRKSISCWEALVDEPTLLQQEKQRRRRTSTQVEPEAQRVRMPTDSSFSVHPVHRIHAGHHAGHDAEDSPDTDSKDATADMREKELQAADNAEEQLHQEHLYRIRHRASVCDLVFWALLHMGSILMAISVLSDAKQEQSNLVEKWTEMLANGIIPSEAEPGLH